VAVTVVVVSATVVFALSSLSPQAANMTATQPIVANNLTCFNIKNSFKERLRKDRVVFTNVLNSRLDRLKHLLFLLGFGVFVDLLCRTTVVVT
jgi:hypothetical protein